MPGKLSKRPSADSVVLVSGGLDSAVTAAIAVTLGRPAFLHVNYGQRTEARELAAFDALCGHYKTEHRLIADIAYLSDIGGSALTDRKIDVPEGDVTRKDIPQTYVPFRNANLLCIAVSWAETLGARSVFIGAVEEDSSGYPDCRREFFDTFEKAITLGTRPGADIKIITPLIRMRKSGIVKKGIELKAPLELTWSCYSDSNSACGKCDSCLLRLRGFKEAGVTDPLKYKKQEEKI